MFKINKNKKGFTLIELLVVIAIIGILTTIALISFSSARQKATMAKLKAEAKGLSTQYYLLQDEGLTDLEILTAVQNSDISYSISQAAVSNPTCSQTEGYPICWFQASSSLNLCVNLESGYIATPVIGDMSDILAGLCEEVEEE